MIDPSAPDWFARSVSVIAIGISIAALIWGRLDKYFEREERKKARQPRARLAFNPHPDADGWLMLKTTFFNGDDEAAVTKATILKPASALIAPQIKASNNQYTRDDASKGRSIPLKWTVLSSKSGSWTDPTTASHIFVYSSQQIQADDIEIEFKGHSKLDAKRTFAIRLIPQA